jgi:hypothetical protein
MNRRLPPRDRGHRRLVGGVEDASKTKNAAEQKPGG